MNIYIDKGSMYCTYIVEHQDDLFSWEKNITISSNYRQQPKKIRERREMCMTFLLLAG